MSFFRELGMPAVCTLRNNRTEKCPFKLEKDLRKDGCGSVDSYMSEDGIVLVKWYNNKEVIMGTNYYSVEPTSRVRRWDKAKKVSHHSLQPGDGRS
jgi:hypothetical protein